jgi:hypothetical protein
MERETHMKTEQPVMVYNLLLNTMMMMMNVSVIPQMWQFVPFATEGLTDCTRYS